MVKPDPDLLAGMNACMVHARDLLESATAVMAIGRPNIAYHLATLSLEELGRRKLIAMQSVATKNDGQHAWHSKATQDHVKKLFWCFYGFSRIDDMVDQARFFEMSDVATTIHANRLAGLYVDDSDQELRVPSETISPQQAQRLIELAEAFVTIAENERPREDISQEEVDLQTWLIGAFDKIEGVAGHWRMGALDQVRDRTQRCRDASSRRERNPTRLRILRWGWKGQMENPV